MTSPSPVITANVKLMGNPGMLCTDVRFRSRSELDAVIHALIALRDGDADDADHVHLQDGRLTSGDGTATEVTFYRPGRRRDAAVSLAIAAARQALPGKKRPTQPASRASEAP